MLSSRKSLTLAVTEQGIIAAQVVLTAGKRSLAHAVELPFTKDLHLGEPEKVGKELKRLLRQNGMQASRCVIGLAAAWTAVREKTLPPADPESLRGVLAITAEREFASGAQELLFDYCSVSSAKNVVALLVAAPRPIVEQAQAVAAAAGLAVTGITSSSAALALATEAIIPPQGRILLCLLPRGAEIVVQSPKGVRLIRYLPARLDGSDVEVDRLAADLRRVLALAPKEPESSASREVLVFNAAGLDRAALDSLSRQLDAPIKVCGARDLGLDNDSQSAPGLPAERVERFTPAAALACLAGKPLAIDFLHSHLAPPRKPRIGRRIIWGSIAAAFVLVVALVLIWDLNSTQQEVADLQARIVALKDSSTSAKEFVENVTFARGWYDHRPEFLDCLKEITQAFPQEGRIWATNLTVGEDMQALLTGKSTNESAVLELVDRLKSNPRLMNVKPLFIRQAGGNSKDTSFAVSLALRKAQ